MAHIHGVYDCDTHFKIDGTTRTVKNMSEVKTQLVQYDHNSERFTFEIPRMIDGHDMSLCDVVEVHFLNVDTSTRKQMPGVYKVDDLQISKEDENIVVGSWLISRSATQYVGELSFSICFACTADDGSIGYAWRTAVYGGLKVIETLYNAEVATGNGNGGGGGSVALDVTLTKSGMAADAAAVGEKVNQLTEETTQNAETISHLFEEIGEQKTYPRYANVAEMLADASLVEGQYVRTSGFYEDGDGGHGEYLIVSEATVNRFDTFATANDKYAVLQHNGHVNAKQCGLKNNTYDGDAWIEYYNGTAKSMDINVMSMYLKKTVVLKNKTEIFSTVYPSPAIYWIGSADAAVFSCFAGDGLHADVYQSTIQVKLHDIAINANTAKVGFCLVNIAGSNISNLYVHRGYIGFLLGNSWRNVFGRMEGKEQRYATFYQEEFDNTDIFDFTVISLNGSINASVYNMMISTYSPNGVLLRGYGSENVFHLIEASEITSESQSIAVQFGRHSGVVNAIYSENGATTYDLYVDNLIDGQEGTSYDYNKGLIINEVRGRRYYLNNNVVIGTLYVEDWVDTDHALDVVFEGGDQADRVSILHMPSGKYNDDNITMPYGVNGVAQELRKKQQKGSYRLVESIVVDAASPLSKTSEPDGTPYNFEAVYLEVELPANTAFPGCNFKAYTDGMVVVADPYLSSADAGTNDRYMFIEIKNEDGFVREAHSKLDTAGNHQALYTTANKAAYKQPAKIVDIRTTQALQPGTVVTIYAY